MGPRLGGSKIWNYCCLLATYIPSPTCNLKSRLWSVKLVPVSIYVCQNPPNNICTLSNFWDLSGGKMRNQDTKLVRVPPKELRFQNPGLVSSFHDDAFFMQHEFPYPVLCELRCYGNRVENWPGDVGEYQVRSLACV